MSNSRLAMLKFVVPLCASLPKTKPIPENKKRRRQQRKPPRSGAGVGVVMVQGWESVCSGVLGIPLLKNKKGLGLSVSCFSSFFMFGFRFPFFGFRLLFSWFRGFLVSKNYQLSMSCLLMDIDLVSNILKIC